MPVKYNVVGRKNPQKPEEAPKFYASAKADGEITLKAIAKEIATGSTTVSDTDVLATLNELTKVLIKHLSNGEIVKFGDFGSFQITITSEGVDDEKKFTAANIKGNKIQFRPGTDLKEMLATVKYEKYKK
ncbi:MULTISPECIES: HU family DNA-binding protein [Capnocytophaga]|uniref:Integration host factor subunit beta n=2 Tax=Capnocytophaga TaxID=1016 RepID=A0A0B7I596_9FLAO|nr:MULTISPECIES: HU family DNA-binding protein [Capnocytophaga]ATA73436.1 DNA-binding protein [Capnocytophaga sp. H4358]ATA75577.1 DNA-binding protein [Capnocytophaga sp. H2931]AWL78753.1 DNA-binding protein [Capnocytophaga canimorsus]AYW37363.1 DNA-binding protein [Capnocytophaga canimorsus]MDT9500135.1 HU family DNA-binding protein [Capnocytophaga canimorsus]